MPVHSRKASSNLQVRVQVPTESGETRTLALSTGTDDPAIAEAMHAAAGVVKTLGRKPSLLRVRAFCEGILEAAGWESPWKADGAERAFLTFSGDYLARRGRKGGVSKLAAPVFREFAKFGKSPSLLQCTPELVQRYHDALVDSKQAPGSIANKLACLSGLFGHAVSLGLMPSNPVAMVDAVGTGGVIEREAFPDHVFVQFMAWLLKSGEPDADSWFAACMLGRYAGMAIIDAANLPCTAVREWDGGQRFLEYVRYKTRKAGKAVVIPVFPPLKEWLESQDLSLPFFCPALAGRPSNVLSARFCRLLELAGAAGKTVVTPSGREMRERTFHSLRAAFVTWLVSLGIPENLRMKLSGHARVNVHRGYDKTKDKELASLLAPYFTSGPSSSSSSS